MNTKFQETGARYTLGLDVWTGAIIHFAATSRCRTVLELKDPSHCITHDVHTSIAKNYE